MSVYLDTAYVAKCYLNEPDAERVREMLRGETGLTSSGWCRAELTCLMFRHVREGNLTRRQANDLHDLFREDWRAGVWDLLPVSDELINEVERRVRRLRVTGLFLRAGDAVHLTSARRAGFTSIWSSDRHLLAAAPRFGLVGKSL